MGTDHTEIFYHTSSCHLIFLLDWEIINNFGKVIYILGNNIHVGGKSILFGGKSIHVGGKSIHVWGKSINFGGKSIHFGSKSIHFGVILNDWEIKTKIEKQLNFITHNS